MRRPCPRPASGAALDELIPEKLLRERAAELPEVSEPEIVRHYNRISRRNFDLDTGFYPLGSCTMKHNPRLNERVAALRPCAAASGSGAEAGPGRARADVAAPAVARRDLRAAAREPPALGGVARGTRWAPSHPRLPRGPRRTRTKVLTPDTAHGTNPATVTMAGFEVVKLETNERGGIELDDLRAKAGDETACLMLTNPNTLGLFDENISEIAKIVHDAGGRSTTTGRI